MILFIYFNFGFAHTLSPSCASSHRRMQFCCPVSGVAFNGKFKFVVFKATGHTVSRVVGLQQLDPFAPQYMTSTSAHPAILLADQREGCQGRPSGREGARRPLLLGPLGHHPRQPHRGERSRGVEGGGGGADRGGQGEEEEQEGRKGSKGRN